MDLTAITEALKQTISDHQVSRSERRVLKQLASEIDLDRHQLSLLKSKIFEVARHEMDAPDEKQINEWVQDVLKAIEPNQKQTVEIESEAFFSPDDGCAQKIVSLIQRARSQIDACVFTITDNRISDALIAAHKRKIAVRIISDNDKYHDLGSDIRRLEERGIPVRIDSTPSHMHHKYSLFDRRWLLTGSYNWTRSAANVNEENIIVTNDPGLMGEFNKHFQSLWERYSS